MEAYLFCHNAINVNLFIRERKTGRLKKENGQKTGTSMVRKHTASYFYGHGNPHFLTDI